MRMMHSLVENPITLIIALVSLAIGAVISSTFYVGDMDVLVLMVLSAAIAAGFVLMLLLVKS